MIFFNMTVFSSAGRMFQSQHCPLARQQILLVVQQVLSHIRLHQEQQHFEESELLGKYSESMSVQQRLSGCLLQR